MTIIQIVPGLPPTISGVGDFSFSLAHQLKSTFDIQTCFLVGDPTWVGSSELEGFSVHQVPSRSAQSLQNLLSQLSSLSVTVVLHYVGYGYAKKGCPIWLVDGLRRWQKACPNSHLVTLFHELYATGPPWSSSFWLLPLQKKLVVDVVNSSHAHRTTLQINAGELTKMSRNPRLKGFNLPVFSSVGEPKTLLPLEERQRRLVVFGTYGRRLPIYQQSYDILVEIIRALGIEEIIDIGKPLTINLDSIDGVPVIVLEEKPADEISQLLLNSVVGVIDYPTQFLGKSTIFAAYCAHGLMPVVVGPNKMAVPADGLKAGQHYWFPKERSQVLDIRQTQAIASQAHSWYQDHNLSAHAQTLAEQLFRPPQATMQRRFQ